MSKNAYNYVCRIMFVQSNMQVERAQGNVR